MEKTLVTGGGGFIGSHLSKYLLKQGNHVRIADTVFSDYIKEQYYTEKFQMDLRKLEDCLHVTRGWTKSTILPPTWAA